MVVFQDEASLSNTASISYQWEIKGKQPQIKQKQKNRERCTLFGCVEPKTGRVLYRNSARGNTVSFFSFLYKTVKAYGQRKVYMVLDNVTYHHAKRIKRVLERYQHRIELLFLPPYSPDLNPMERIWWYMRKSISHNRFLESMEVRLAKFIDFMTQFELENQRGKTLCNLCSIIN